MTGARTESGRLTPYELVFGGAELADEEFPLIADEAGRRGVEAGRRDRFAQLESVAHLLGQMVPESADTAAFDRYLDTLFHCYHFWRSGFPLFVLDEAVARSLIENAPRLSGWSPDERGSVYIELPRNLFWAGVIADEPPEPVEGMFIRIERDEGRTATEILLILGMRADRPGFSTAGLRVDLDHVPEVEPGAFRSELPGSELADLYALGRPAEAVTLALLTLWYIDSYPEAAERVEPRTATEPVAGDVGPTSLAYVRLREVERDRE